MNEVKGLKTVIFVCIENANRSQIAQAFAHIHGGDKVEAFSAGSHPSGRINPKAFEAMKEVGYPTHRRDGAPYVDEAGLGWSTVKRYEDRWMTLPGVTMREQLCPEAGSPS